MARIYWVQTAGARHYRQTLAQAKAFAQRVANDIGSSVTVGYDDVAAPRTRDPRAMRANPMGLDEMSDLLASMSRDLVERRHIADERKPRRVAKEIRRGGKSAAPPAGGGSRYLVDVRKGGETYSLTMPSRAKADDLAAVYKATGYKVAVRPMQ